MPTRDDARDHSLQRYTLSKEDLFPIIGFSSYDRRLSALEGLRSEGFIEPLTPAAERVIRNSERTLMAYNAAVTSALTLTALAIAGYIAFQNFSEIISVPISTGLGAISEVFR